MADLRMEQIEYAVSRLGKLIEARDVTQTQLAQLSGVNQSTISKILSRSGEAERYTPSAEILKKLFKAVGFKLSDILSDADSVAEELLGYLATPLTALTAAEDAELRRLVLEVKGISSDRAFGSPPFEMYWPGDHTHPLQHAQISANNVYMIDRARASTHDFILLFCAAPSYGVGQESEIATQAGVPAIRLIPETGLSRMMLGSFVRAYDVVYKGSLGTRISLDHEGLKKAFQDVRRAYFRNRALYRGLGCESFGTRLRDLIVDRCGLDYQQAADDLGISISYLRALMNEPFAVSNPSGVLLRRMAMRLGESVAYLLGDGEESDSLWIESKASWRKWVSETPGLEASIALDMRDEWCNEYRAAVRERRSSSSSFRSSVKVMREVDWDKRYRLKTKVGASKQDSLI